MIKTNLKSLDYHGMIKALASIEEQGGFGQNQDPLTSPCLKSCDMELEINMESND
jgi:hypothetical protein